MYTYINPSSGYRIGNDGNLEYHRTQDGHGGRAAEHRAEMEQIAERIADQKLAAIVPQIQATALQQARDDLLRAIAFDVETVVEIAFHSQWFIGLYLGQQMVNETAFFADFA